MTVFQANTMIRLAEANGQAVFVAIDHRAVRISKVAFSRIDCVGRTRVGVAGTDGTWYMIETLDSLYVRDQ